MRNTPACVISISNCVLSPFLTRAVISSAASKDRFAKVRVACCGFRDSNAARSRSPARRDFGISSEMFLTEMLSIRKDGRGASFAAAGVVGAASSLTRGAFCALRKRAAVAIRSTPRRRRQARKFAETARRQLPFDLRGFESLPQTTTTGLSRNFVKSSARESILSIGMCARARCVRARILLRRECRQKRRARD